MNSGNTLNFHSLPTEMRLKIWGHAVENIKGFPDSHFFQIGGSFRERIKDVAASQTSNNESRKDMCPVHPPSWGPKGSMSCSWVSPENPSCYTTTAALWNTCSESREVIVKHFIKTNPEFDLRQIDNFKLRLVFSFSSFTMNVERDLHCFQVQDVNEYTTMAVGSRDMLPKHIAFEYKAEWGEPSLCNSIQVFHEYCGRYADMGYSHRNELEEMLLAIAQDKHSVSPSQHIWFIDYNIKPARRLTKEDINNLHVFHAKGQKFVEVGDSRHWVSRYRYRSAGARDNFVQWFQSFFLREEFGPDNQLPMPSVGVLACLVESDFF